MNRPGDNSTDGERIDERAVDSLAFKLIVLLNLIIKPFQSNFGDQYNISLVEWRCMMWLAAKPGSSGAETATGVGMDRMNVSRGLRSLRDKKYTQCRRGKDDRKKWQWRLTDEGWKVYDNIAVSAIERDQLLLQSLDGDQRVAVVRFLEDAIVQLRRAESEAKSGHGKISA